MFLYKNLLEEVHMNIHMIILFHKQELYAHCRRHYVETTNNQKGMIIALIIFVDEMIITRDDNRGNLQFVI